MTTVSMTDLHDHLPDTIERVRYTKDRVLVQKHNKEVAAVVSVEDVRLLEALEDLVDLHAAIEALHEMESDGGSVTVEEFRQELGL